MTRHQKLLVTKGIATRSKKLLVFPIILLTAMVFWSPGCIEVAVCCAPLERSQVIISVRFDKLTK